MSAYLTGEFGLDPGELAATSLLYLTEGTASDEDGSDERYHVAGGNDLIVSGLAERLPNEAVERDAPLVALSRAGEDYRLEIGGTGEVQAERVVLALPFTTLREVDLDAAGLSDAKREAIAELGMGTNSKLLLQFEERPEAYEDWSGDLFSDHPFQWSWDTSITQEGAAGLITVYYGGDDGTAVAAPEGGHGEAPEALVARHPGGARAGRAWHHRRLQRQRVRLELVEGPVGPRLLRRLRARADRRVLPGGGQAGGRHPLRRRAHGRCLPGLPRGRRRVRGASRPRGRAGASIGAWPRPGRTSSGSASSSPRWR